LDKARQVGLVIICHPEKQSKLKILLQVLKDPIFLFFLVYGSLIIIRKQRGIKYFNNFLKTTSYLMIEMKSSFAKAFWLHADNQHLSVDFDYQ